jgi:uncharacterized protein YprB with RNaseH-like and TPR domain
LANLKDRLKRIQEQKKSETPGNVSGAGFVKVQRPSPDDLPVFMEGWDACGFKTLKRDITVDTQLDLQAGLPSALAILVPDLAGRNLPELKDFVFFDLETTGLSGGAGTVAFLAAFGKPQVPGKLRITQYLLLDYPGEDDFLMSALEEFKNERIMVSYNGKCFDSQIIKTRCLMNGIKPPEYPHVDLLHPARRLWKNIINDCSQSSIEAQILGIDRGDDIPGALAPEIWFDFLKTGRHERLIGICDHNSADIAGLASILAAVILIAGDPVGEKKYRYDLQRLALYWREYLRRAERSGNSFTGAGDSELRITGDRLLRLASDKNYPQAALVYAVDQLRNGNYEEGRKKLLGIAESDFPENVKAASLRFLAIDSERRLKDFSQALEFVKRGLTLEQTGNFWRSEFENRKERLEKKVKCY